MTALYTPEQINRFRLVSLRSAVKLEAAGMTRRGKSATSIARAEMKLPKSASRDDVLKALDAALA